MHLDDLRAPRGARPARRRVGRGIGSGLGKTAGRGTKGQHARSGEGRPRGFEGGQMPLQRRLPKRGFGRGHCVPTVEINVGQLGRFAEGTVVDPALLRQQRLVGRPYEPVRVLGDGDLAVSLVVRAQHFSATARTKIEAAGGTCEVIEK